MARGFLSRLGSHRPATLRNIEILDARQRAVAREHERDQAARSAELERRLGAMATAVVELHGLRESATRSAREAVWAQVFHDTVTESTWFTRQALSPGRWAAGYPFLYVLYRILDEARPTFILELGLGQSTKLTAQYAASNPASQHIVVEHDPEWIAAFEANFALGSAPRSVDRGGQAARATAGLMVDSNSTGVKPLRRSCGRRWW